MIFEIFNLKVLTKNIMVSEVWLNKDRASFAIYGIHFAPFRVGNPEVGNLYDELTNIV